MLVVLVLINLVYGIINYDKILLYVFFWLERVFIFRYVKNWDIYYGNENFYVMILFKLKE